MKQAIMNDENRSSNLGNPTARITKAREKSLSSSSGLPPLYPSAKRDEKRVSPASLKRAAPHKPAGYHAAVLKDVTNINCGNLFMNCINAAKCQDYQPIRQERKVPSQKKGKAEPVCFAETSEVVEDKGETIVEEMQKVKAELCQEVCPDLDLPTEPTEFTYTKILATAGAVPPKIKSISCRDEGVLHMETFEDSGIINIDSKHKYPQMCSLYAADIYTIFFERQLDQRPSADYMERLQGDITQHMRGILIDWLVECEMEKI